MLALTCVLSALSILAYAQDLPTLPQSFTVSIEINHIDANRTTRVDEYFDYENQRIRADYYSGERHEVTVWDLKERLVHSLHNFNNCTVRNLTEAEEHSFLNGTHLVGASTILHFGSQYEETYQGERRARGILCEHWLSEEIPDEYNNGSYTIDYFFSDPAWLIAEAGNFWSETAQMNYRVPIQAVINGTSMEDGNLTSYTTVIEFLFFDEGTPDPGAFTFLERFLCAHITQPDLPTLPDQFEANIEFTIADSNYTSIIHEYHDSVDMMARYDYQRHGEHVTEIINIPEGYRFSIRHGHDCHYHAINTSSFEGTTTMMSTAQMFHFGAQFDETYHGIRLVRGIPCDYWTTQIAETNTTISHNYTLGWYFSVEEWRMRGSGNASRVPVLAEVRGTRTANGTTSPFHHYYHFVHWVAGAPDPQVFVPPSDVVCRSELDVPLPAVIDSFSTTVEITNFQLNSTTTFQEHYDLEHDRLRVDWNNNGRFGSTIMLLNQSTMYVYIENGPDDAMCQVMNTSGTGLRHLSSVGNLLHFGAQFNESYQGTRKVRGILCDYWASSFVDTNPMTNITRDIEAHYFFSRTEWTLTSSRNFSELVAVDFRGTQRTAEGVESPFSERMEFVGFTPETSHDSVFFPPAEWECPINPFHMFVSFVFENETSSFDFSGKHFAANLSASLSVPKSSIRVLQISNEATGAADANRITVLVELSFASHSDRDSAEKNLLTSAGQFWSAGGVSVATTYGLNCPTCVNGACYFGRCVCNDGYTGDNCDQESSGRSGISKSTAAGIGLGFLALGIVIGLAVFFAVFRKKVRAKAQLEMYKLHNDTEGRSGTEEFM
eukprot:TRINITY_DN1629_c0_g1_i1.p1 TRINITY_DN1629_c0_g1~~TRINITY_DN1629_c0_g1_i1.p1  ORF type:complete len:833 (-),score=171.02 TRINITY_DN1629_c0_g1_i1:58-2556(-)